MFTLNCILWIVLLCNVYYYNALLGTRLEIYSHWHNTLNFTTYANALACHVYRLENWIVPLHFLGHVFTDHFKLKMHCFHLLYRKNSTYKTIIISLCYCIQKDYIKHSTETSTRDTSVAFYPNLNNFQN